MESPARLEDRSRQRLANVGDAGKFDSWWHAHTEAWKWGDGIPWPIFAKE
jgi:hypothetical protein